MCPHTLSFATKFSWDYTFVLSSQILVLLLQSYRRLLGCWGAPRAPSKLPHFSSWVVTTGHCSRSRFANLLKTPVASFPHPPSHPPVDSRLLRLSPRPAKTRRSLARRLLPRMLQAPHHRQHPRTAPSPA